MVNLCRRIGYIFLKLNGNESIQLPLIQLWQTQYRNPFISQFIALVHCRMTTYGAFRCFVVVNFSRFVCK